MNVTSGAQAVDIATKWLGTPYKWGGGHGGPVPVGTPVDCSGLVDQVFGIQGNTATQIKMGSAISSISNASPGDLVFFGPLAPGEPYHVGIYTGAGSMIDAPHTGTNVRRDSVGGFGTIDGIRRLVSATGTGGGSTTQGGSGGSSVHFTYAQLEGLWIQAGGNPTAAPMAAAIATAESDGNSDATDNDANGSVDRGLWQINSVHGSQSTYDVMGNARAAVSISNNGTNWSPWVTYQNGAYLQYIQQGVAPDYSAPINATNATANLTGVIGTPLGGPFSGSGVGGLIGEAIDSVVGVILNPLIEIVAGMLGIVGGGGMMIFGIYMLISQTQAGRQAGSGAMTAAGVATGQPELTALGTGGLKGLGRWQLGTERGQQVAARQQARSQQIMQRQFGVEQSRTAREVYRQQMQTQRKTTPTSAQSQMTERERLRQEHMTERERMRGTKAQINAEALKYKRTRQPAK